jgi:hypothetical protein
VLCPSTNAELDRIKWMRIMSITGVPATTIPVEEGEEGADDLEEEEDKDPEALVEEAMELAKKLRKLVSTAVCADR